MPKTLQSGPGALLTCVSSCATTWPSGTLDRWTVRGAGILDDEREGLFHESMLERDRCGGELFRNG